MEEFKRGDIVYFDPYNNELAPEPILSSFIKYHHFIYIQKHIPYCGSISRCIVVGVYSSGKIDPTTLICFTEWLSKDKPIFNSYLYEMFKKKVHNLDELF